MSTKPNPRARIILISGSPASGKTMLSKKIARQFELPVFSSDGIKEVMFNNLEWNKLDDELFGKVGKTAFELLYHVMESCLSSHTPVILEANFNPKHNNDRIKKIISDFSADVFYIFCRADADIIEKRFRERVESGARHAGHKNDLKLKEDNYLQKMLELNQRLDIGVNANEIDTTQPQEINYNKLFNEINIFLHSA